MRSVVVKVILGAGCFRAAEGLLSSSQPKEEERKEESSSTNGPAQFLSRIAEVVSKTDCEEYQAIEALRSHGQDVKRAEASILGIDSVGRPVGSMSQDQDEVRSDVAIDEYFGPEEAHLVTKDSLLGELANVNEPINEDGRTLLHSYSLYGDSETVARLRDYPGIDPNTCDQTGMSPLHSAARKNHPNAVSELLKYPSINVNCKESSRGRTPLHVACSKNNPDVVEVLLKDDRVDIGLLDSRQKSALYHAVETNCVEVVQLFASAHEPTNDKRDANVNQTNKDQKTPLYLACCKGRVDIVQALLAHPSIDVNQQGKHNVTALYAACRNGNTENKQKHYASVVKLLLERSDLNVNLTDTLGVTPLFKACQKGCTDIVKVLLERADVDVNQATTDPQQSLVTPLFIACQEHHLAIEEDMNEVIRMLVSHPHTNVNAARHDGATPLFIASQYGSLQAVIYLLGHPDIDLNPPNFIFKSINFKGCPTDKDLGIIFKGVTNKIENMSENLKLTKIGSVRVFDEIPVGELTVGEDITMVVKPCSMKSECVAAENGFSDITDVLRTYPTLKYMVNKDLPNTTDSRSLAVVLGLNGMNRNLKFVVNRGRRPKHHMLSVRHVLFSFLFEPLIDPNYVQPPPSNPKDETTTGGKTSFHIFCAHGVTTLVTRFLNSDSNNFTDRLDLNAQDENGNSPIMSAMKNNHVQVVNLLLNNDPAKQKYKQKLDVNLKNTVGKTFLDFAVENNNVGIVQDLLEFDGQNLKSELDVDAVKRIIAKADDDQRLIALADDQRLIALAERLAAHASKTGRAVIVDLLRLFLTKDGNSGK